MKKRRVSILLIFILIAGVTITRLSYHIKSLTPSGFNEELYVARVIDGDTIELSNRESLRYIGIDTPEIRKKKKGKWVYEPRPYAEEAREFNRKLVEGKMVRLEFDVEKRDRYNRLLAYVYLVGEDSSGEEYSLDKMVNLEMVRQGFAMIYTHPPNVKYVEEFLKAQKDARENKRGLWDGLERDVISSYEAEENLGLVREVETEVLSTFISSKVLILNCRDNFKAVIFKNNLAYFPKELSRSPYTYFNHKTIRVYGLIEQYKTSYEIVLQSPSQLEIID